MAVSYERAILVETVIFTDNWGIPCRGESTPRTDNTSAPNTAEIICLERTADAQTMEDDEVLSLN